LESIFLDDQPGVKACKDMHGKVDELEKFLGSKRKTEFFPPKKELETMPNNLFKSVGSKREYNETKVDEYITKKLETQVKGFSNVYDENFKQFNILCNTITVEGSLDHLSPDEIYDAVK